MYWKLSHVRPFATPWTIQSMEFSRPEYWSGWPFPSPGDLSHPGIEPRSPALLADSLPTELSGKPQCRRELERIKRSELDALVAEANALAIFTKLFMLIFWLHQGPFGILVPWLLSPQALYTQCSSHWTAREFPPLLLYLMRHFPGHSPYGSPLGTFTGTPWRLWLWFQTTLIKQIPE